MAFFKSPEEMYTARAKSFRSSADRHWSMAKSGQGGFHYAAARKDYEAAEQNVRMIRMLPSPNINAKNKSELPYTPVRLYGNFFAVPSIDFSPETGYTNLIQTHPARSEKGGL